MTFNEIYLKFGDRFLISLTILGLQVRASICSKIKGNLPLYCPKFLEFVIVAKRSVSQRNSARNRNH